jgi:tyrosyl-tRNA synthetase
MLHPLEQIDIIKKGAVEIIEEQDLIKKLERSYQTSVPLKIKAGFDPTAPDIHIGHTVMLEKMRQFQELGHEIIFLIGDFTGMIGDPSGKNEMRKPLSEAEVKKNAATYQEQVSLILDPQKTRIEFNSRWMSQMSSAEMIRVASSSTVARMLEREDFKQRFASHNPIGIHEFLYPLIQGYDSVALKADVELGGTDQRFNLLVGRHLQSVYGQEPQAIVMMPLLEGTDGVKKMSKSLNNYIGIAEPPLEMYGKIMSITDDLMIRYYELLSRMTNAEFNRLKEGLKNGSIHPKKAKENLAFEIVERFCGADKAKQAGEQFNQVFAQKKQPDEIPVATVKWKTEALWIAHIMKETGLTKSTSEALRLINQGAVTINEELCKDSDKKLPCGDYTFKVGKRRFMIIKGIQEIK